MTILPREDVASLLRSPDDTTVAEILTTGASREELTEAFEWRQKNEALMNDGRPLPSGRVAQVMEILEADEDQRLSEPE